MEGGTAGRPKGKIWMEERRPLHWRSVSQAEWLPAVVDCPPQSGGRGSSGDGQERITELQELDGDRPSGSLVTWIP